MLKKLKQAFFALTEVTAIEIVFQQDGRYTMHVAVVSLKGNKLKIEKTFSGIETSSLKKAISQDTPIVLSFTGRGVIHEKIKGKEMPESEVDLISLVLPDSKLSDFYMQKFEQGDEFFVSILRRESLDGVLQTINELGFFVVQTYLGPFTLTSSTKLLELENETLSLPGNTIGFNDGLLTEVKAASENGNRIFKINGNPLDPSLLVAFSAAFATLLEEEFKGIDDSEIEKERQEFWQMKIFKKGKIALAAILFILSGSNYVWYNSLVSENAQYAMKSIEMEGSIKKSKKLEKKVKEKEYFLKSAGWFSIPRPAYYADDIATFIPEAIQLKELRINPLNEKLSKMNKGLLYFSADTIVISGTCSDSKVLNPWIDDFKDRRWVKKFRNTGYTRDYKSNEGTFHFEASILNHEN